jgi:hypothetical protein
MKAGMALTQRLVLRVLGETSSFAIDPATQFALVVDTHFADA